MLKDIKSVFMKINDLPLPKDLLGLIEQGRWKSPNPIVMKSIIEGCLSGEFHFNSIKSMQRESDMKHRITDKEFSKQRGLASSTLLGMSIEETNILDIDNAIMIAQNYDGEAICLDYRLSLENPRVVASTWKDRYHMEWHVIAPDFPTFIAMSNL